MRPALYKTGTGALTLATSNAYAGGTTINAGTLVINNASALGTGALTINGGKLDNTSSAAITMSGNIPQSWNGNFEFIGTQSLNMGAGAVTLSPTSASTVTATIDNGTLNVGRILSTTAGLTKAGTGILAITTAANSSIGGPLNVAAGTLQINTGATTADFHAKGLTGSGTVVNGGGAVRWLYIDSNESDTFSGVLANGGSAGLGLAFDFPGNGGTTGQLTLTGSNTYNSETVLGGGTLQLGTGIAGEDGSIGNTADVRTQGGNASTLVFNLAGSQTAAYPISTNGNTAITLIKTGPGTLTLSGTHNLYTNGTTVANGTLIVTNAGAIADGTSLTVGDPSLFSAPVVPPPTAAPAVSVPEPSTLTLAAAAALAVAALARKRLRG